MLTIGNSYCIDSSISYGDKSITHRALILASIASSRVVITYASTCLDCMSTIECLRILGANITVQGTTITVGPITVANSGVTLPCGNSGTTARLLAGLVAGLGVDATLVGDSSLMLRPFDRVVEPLTLMGAHITTEDNIIMHIHKGYALHGITYDMPVASAQVKSALLIAGLYASGNTTVLESIPTRDHTERMLQYMGVDCNNCTVTASSITAKHIDVPNDMSCAIYGIVLALLGKGGVFANVGINNGRMGAIQALIGAGGNICLHNKRQLCGEWRADIDVVPSTMRAIDINSTMTVSAIDDILPLSVVASMVQGTSSICGIAELAHKESNRIHAVVDIATQLGAVVSVVDDNITILGNASNGAHVYVDTIDHRVAMTAIIAGLLSDGASIDGYQCIAVSCPQFLSWLGISHKSFALIGGNVAGSLSPYICGLHSRASGINASYDLVSVDSVDDASLMNIIARYDGVNVTMPYKTRVATLLDSQLDSVNTICGTATYSTDGIGMIASITRHGVSLAGANVLVIGAGGASISVCRALIDNGAHVYVVNRTSDKAERINAMLGCSAMHHYDGIVSCVPPCSYELDVVQGISAQWVASVSYRSDSYLKQWADNNNMMYIGGLGMLYYQAKASYEIWCNTRVADCMSQLEESYDDIISQRC